MTRRKPARTSFESWVETQISEAQDRGDFENLPGLGKPIPPDDPAAGDDWWIRQKLRRENAEFDGSADAVLNRIERARIRAIAAPTDRAALQIVKAVNKEILTYRIDPPPGRPLILELIDAAEILAERRSRG